jgi:hypothetical protein
MQLIFKRGNEVNLAEKKNIRLPLLVKTLQGNFLFNGCEGFTENLNVPINHILVTHMEGDIVKGLSEMALSNDDFMLQNMKLYITKELFDKINQKIVMNPFDIYYINHYEPFMLEGTNIEIVPFELGEHSTGFRFDNMVYMPPKYIPLKSEKYLYSVKSLIIDGNSKEAFKLVQRFKPMNCYLTRKDVSVIEIDKEKKHGFRGIKYHLIEEGDKVNVEREFVQRLSEEGKTMTLAHSKCELIANKEAKLIVLGKEQKELVDSVAYLTDGNKCFGVIKIEVPYKINMEDFDELKEEHKISQEEKEKWWQYKEILYAYPFKIIEIYKEPRKVILDREGSIKEFINDKQEKVTEFKSKEEVIENMEEGKYVVENCIDGIEVTVKKIGGIVSIEKKDSQSITYSFPTIVENVKRLTGKELILKGVIKTEKESILYLYDIIKYGKKELRRKQWYVRKSALGELNFSENIRQIESTVANSLNDLDTVLSMVSGLTQYNSVVIKPFTSKYKEKYINVNLRHKVKELEATTTSSPGIEGIQGHSIGDEVERPNKKKKKEENENDDEELSQSNIKNHSFFNTWSADMAYYLGFLTSDGNLDNKSDRIEFGINKQDGEILRELAKKLGDTTGPKMISGSLTYRFKSKEMAKKLRELGMDVKKPTRKTHLKVPSQYLWDFIRGIFDADGSVNEDRIQHDTGNRNLSKWLVNQFKKITPNIKHYSYESTDKIVVIGEDAAKIHKKIYSGVGPRISRKANKSIKVRTDGKKER